ncbi:reverse transcriptase family protein [Aeromonas hydrophila]|uniref:reverse transcriptase family protein n=1 Tax=Aeromonas hydrophila TaxID=644 RepID=UPI0021F409FB|nr:reverse transcriptase family protein [Aeromonas hydrophila]MCV9382777.1 reverse transcriptase family protein [Aeromonas hydrophila]HDT5864730.1 RNA-directed DNA polymerase [Aeromonas hydrophila subsp. hydrophila]
MNKDNLFELLEIDESFINAVNAISYSPEHFYRKFHIPKKKGGFREIHAPYPSLLALQKIISEKIQPYLKIHRSCFSYRKNISFIDNAAHHLGSKEILSLDIEDFFGNISRQKVFDVLSQSGFNNHLSNEITYLVTYKDYLPQGAPTSPIISNSIFYKIDARLYKLSEKLNLKYSRYADDITISGEKIPSNFPRYIEDILLQHGFSLNKGKTRLKKGASKKIITGVSITSGRVMAPRIFKRNLRTEIYHLERNNYAISSPIDPMLYERLIGKLNFLLQVEPENTYAIEKKKALIEKYKKIILMI